MIRLKRKIDDFLIEWKKNKNKLPLIVKGARQIGKTDAIENFAKNNVVESIEKSISEDSKIGKIEPRKA